MTQQYLSNWLKSLIKTNNLHAFYTCPQWLRLRSEVLKEQNNECQVCKANKQYSKADIVHHIKYVRHRPELALTKDNLMCVCSACHNEIHKAKHEYINNERW